MTTKADHSVFNERIINFRLNWKSDRLKNGSLRINPDNSWNNKKEIENNNIERKTDLAVFLSALYELHKAESVFYGDSLKQFAGRQVIRCWPWIDGEITVSAQKSPNYSIHYLTDLFDREAVTSDEFFFWINYFQKQHREQWKNHIFRKKKKTATSPDKPLKEQLSIVHRSLTHLAKMLMLLHGIYQKKPKLYGQKFKAFFGNDIVREWPMKDFPFTSTGYQKEKKSIYEHYTPISFFRDMLDDETLNKTPLSEKDYFDALYYFYRIVYVAKEEDDRLNVRFKTTRPVNAYELCQIRVKEVSLWKELYGNLDKELIFRIK